MSHQIVQCIHLSFVKFNFSSKLTRHCVVIVIGACSTNYEGNFLDLTAFCTVVQSSLQEICNFKFEENEKYFHHCKNSDMPLRAWKCLLAIF